MRAALVRLNALSIVLGAFGFALSTLFVPGWSSPAHLPRWALLSAAVFPFILLCIPHIRLTLGHLLWFVLIGWSALSLLWTGSGLYEGIFQVWNFILFAGVFAIGAELKDIRPLIVGLGLGIGINSALLGAQLYGLIDLPQIQCCSALYVNPVFLAETATLVLIAAVGYRLWWLVPLILPSVLLTGSRGALVALAGAGIAWVWSRHRTGAVFLAAMVLLAGFWMLTSADHNASGSQRLSIWRDMIPALKVFGNGIGSFYTQYPLLAPTADTLFMRPTHAHNDILELVFELGAGAAVYGALLIFALRGSLMTERLMLVAFLIEGSVGFPLHFPVTGFVFALAAGRLCAGRLCLRNVLNDCRARHGSGVGYWPLGPGGGRRPARASGAVVSI